MLGEKKLESPPKFKPPRSLSFQQWFQYFANVASLAPKPSKPGEFPQGVKVLGGTYVLDGRTIVFAHEDEVPGATPEIAQIVNACCS
mmetsp:Transcript_30522/g.66896  ORF Transcript_30522/g.66896 Transcript_30522/m.66896 type:complete len:87 (-) Transcript_30522:351-611(-)